MEDEQQLQQDIVLHTQLAVMPGTDPEIFRQKLADYVNHLVNNDFNKLVLILYRLDVNEKKLKQLLATESAIDAGRLIATLIIERQLEKIKLRKQYSRPTDNIPDDEKW